MAERTAKFTEIVLDFDAPGEAGAVSPKPGEFRTFLKGGVPEMVEFLCPCGCGSSVHLYLVGPERPRNESRHYWDYKTNGNLIHPSVHHTTGCKAHYVIKADGTLTWH